MGRQMTEIGFLLLFCLLSLFFMYSKRMNARLEPGSIAQRLLALAQAPLDEDASAAQKLLARLPQKARRLLDTRLSPLLLLFTSWLTVRMTNFLNHGALIWKYGQKRSVPVEQVLQARPEAWKYFFLVLLVGIMGLLPFFLVRKNREFYFDTLALFLLLYFSIYKWIACWRGGCCFGIPWSWGRYHPVLEITLFPVQLFEFGVGLLCSILCLFYMLYGKTYKPGRACSVCLISYSAPRFVWDYFRYFEGNFRQVEMNGLFGLTMVQVVCIVAVALAVIWLFLLPLEKKLMDRLWKHHTSASVQPR